VSAPRWPRARGRGLPTLLRLPLLSLLLLPPKLLLQALLLVPPLLLALLLPQTARPAWPGGWPGAAHPPRGRGMQQHH